MLDAVKRYWDRRGFDLDVEIYAVGKRLGFRLWGKEVPPEDREPKGYNKEYIHSGRMTRVKLETLSPPLPNDDEILLVHHALLKAFPEEGGNG
jgi:hypothetical protein